MFERFTTAILQRRVFALCALLVFVGSVAAGMVRLGADFSVNAFFGREDPETAFLEGYLERWGEDDLLLIVVDGGETGLLTRDNLTAVDGLADEISAIDGVARVMSLTRVPRVHRGFAGMWIPVPLLSTVPSDEDAGKDERWKQSLLADSRVVPSFLSADGRYGVVMVALDVDTANLTEFGPSCMRWKLSSRRKTSRELPIAWLVFQRFALTSSM
jgi:predicted RND superfamily exporter protein